ncbi:hypothetical protein KD050_20775 [Psychrobacillus sp. INOP01]|uniref:hypothetical protein n=1 Tax=Psychrobacillus sp. INOP01 TaxID=2829187 RepID=UPI001BABE395|nr:hypothetical protein [Psychrobacillus sp. INOP01]QUG41663.1 hypothetical protein KD050_20775 [Psychrobacillus sp. INOP01]
MKNKKMIRWVAFFIFLVIFIVYSWELISSDWSYSLARLPSVISFLISSMFGIFISFPRKEKTQ